MRLIKLKQIYLLSLQFLNDFKSISFDVRPSRRHEHLFSFLSDRSPTIENKIF